MHATVSFAFAAGMCLWCALGPYARGWKILACSVALLMGWSRIYIGVHLPFDVLGGLVVAGLGSAPIYPAIIHSTPANFGRGNSAAVIGTQMATAYLGSTFAPPLFGVLSTWTGMWIFPLFVAVLAALGLVMSERLNRVVGR